MSRPGDSGLLVVMVNYRSAALAGEALRSLEPEVRDLPGTRVVVVDNPGGGDDAKVLRRTIDEAGFAAWCSLLPLDRNGGFASGNNAAIRQALAADRPPAYFLLLNPDTVVQPGALRALWAFMECHPDAGIAGSQLLKPDGSPASCAFRFPGLLSELDTGLRLGIVSRALARHRTTLPLSENDQRADWVSGASLVLRREVLEQVGLLDEAFFLYFEEVDLCRRAQGRGWTCYSVPASRVLHLEGQSTGVTDPKRGRRRLPSYWYASRRRYYAKNHSPAYAAVADLVRLTAYLAYRLRCALTRRPAGTPERFARDLLRHSLGGPGPASRPAG